MKPTFILLLFALGTLISVTFAAPTSSDSQQVDDIATSNKELLKLLDQIARFQQEGEGELDLNSQPAEAQFFKKLLSVGKRIIGTHRKGIFKGAGRFAGGLVGGYLNGGGVGGYGSEYGYPGYKMAKRQETVSQMQQAIDDDTDAKIQFLGKIFRAVKGIFGGSHGGYSGGYGGYGGGPGPYETAKRQQDVDNDAKIQLLGTILGVAKGLLGGVGGGAGGHCHHRGGYKISNRQMQLLTAQQDDDNNAHHEGHEEDLNELESLIAKQEGIRDTVTKVEEQQKGIDAIGRQDNLAESAKDDDVDAELQRRRRGKKKRRGRGHQHGRRRWRGRGSRGYGGGWSRVIGNLAGSFFGSRRAGGYPPMGGGYLPSGGIAGQYPSWTSSPTGGIGPLGGLQYPQNGQVGQQIPQGGENPQNMAGIPKGLLDALIEEDNGDGAERQLDDNDEAAEIEKDGDEAVIEDSDEEDDATEAQY